jgi:hypothetical protein
MLNECPVGYDPKVIPPKKQGRSVYVGETLRVAAMFRLPEDMEEVEKEMVREKMRERGLREITKPKKAQSRASGAASVAALMEAAGISASDLF